jgi:transcriptional regulator with XRE-family HTH domain
MNNQEKITIDIIQKLLREQNKSKKELCEFLGLSPTNFGNWISGRNVSFMKYTHKIAEYFGVPVAYLLNEEKEKAPGTLTEGEKLLIDTFRRVPVDKQELVLQMIRLALDNQE